MKKIKRNIKLDDLYMSEEEQQEYDNSRKPVVPVRNEGEANSAWFERRKPYTASKIKTAIGDLRYKDLLDFLDSF